MHEYLAENANLRQWSRRYVAGEITLEDYRAARRSIIEALEAGSVASVLPSQVQDFVATLSEASHDPQAFEESGDWSGPSSSVLTPANGVPVASGAAAPASSGLDPNSLVLAIILGLAALTGVGVLVYVFVL
jgi:hypothetical protein